MKNLIQTILVSVLILSCSKNDNVAQPSKLYKPIAMSVFCQDSPNDTVRRVEYEYDNDKLIMESTAYNVYTGQRTATFEYNPNNMLMAATTVIFYEPGENGITLKNILEYNDLNQLTSITYKVISFNSNGQVVESESEAPLEYEDNHLIKKWWQNLNGFNTYEYKDGKVATKTEYVLDDTRNSTLLDLTKYTYSGELKVEERKETATGDVVYIRAFQYDAENRLVKTIENGNIVEENYYSGAKLTEKRTYYFGTEPASEPCSRNYIYRYEY